MVATAYIRSLTSLAATLALAASIVCHPVGHSRRLRRRPHRRSGPRKPKPTSKDAPPASKGDQAIVVLVNDEPVTAYQIEQRARFLALNANISEQAKENFQRLVKAESTTAQFRALQEEVIRSQSGQIARADHRHLAGAPKAVGHEAAEAGYRRCPRRVFCRG